MSNSPDISATRSMYIDLLRAAILNDIYKDPPILWSQLPKGQTRNGLTVEFVVGDTHSDNQREGGTDWPSVAHSMIGRKRMENLQICVETVLQDGIEGDFIETGVWRGGACIFMQGILQAYGETDRRVFVADSFEGLPKPDEAKYPADRGDPHHLFTPLAVSMEEVKKNFSVYSLLGDNVHFLKGWFKDTLPEAPIEKLAVLRLDGDMYESTMDGLNNLYHKVSPGGFVIVDDYGAVAACKEAVHDYLRTNGLEDGITIHNIDGIGVFWRIPSR